MKEKMILTKPKYGWAILGFPCNDGLHKISLSYINDIPDYFLNSFLKYFNHNDTNLILDIDEEGNSRKMNQGSRHF